MAATRPPVIERDLAGSELGPTAAAAPDDRRPDAPRWVRPVLLVAVALPALVSTIAALRHPWLPTSDNAQLLLRALDVPSHLPLTGAYSRYAFEHPGPLGFYVLALPSHLFGPSGMLLASGALNAVAAMGCVAVGWRRGGPVLAVATTAVLLLVVHAMGDALVSPWNPWVAVLPFLLSVLLAWGVSQRDWVLLPWLVVTASYAASSHLSYAPFAALLVLGGLVAAATGEVRARRAASIDDGPRRGPGLVVLGISVGLLVLCWLAPLVQQVTGEDGNLARIAHHFVTDHSDEPATSAFTETTLPGGEQVLGIVAREMGALAPWAGGPEEVDPFSADVARGNPALLLPTIVLFAVALGLAIRRRATDALALQAIVGGLAVLTGLSLTRVTGELAPYIIRITWIPGSLLVLSSVWSIARGLGAPAPAAGTAVGSGRRVASPASPGLIASVVGVVVLAIVMSGLLVGTEAPDQRLSDLLVPVVAPTAASLPPGKEVRVVSAGDGAAELAIGLEADLIRRGVPVAVDPTVAARYGAGHIGSDPRPATVIVVAGPDQPLPAPSPTARLVAEHDPLTADERREYSALRAQAGANYAAVLDGRPMPVPLSADEAARYAELTPRALAIRVYLDEDAGPG